MSRFKLWTSGKKIEMYHSVLSGGDLRVIFQQKLNEAKFTIAHQHLQKPSDYGAVLSSITIRISLCHFSRLTVGKLRILMDL